MVIIINILVIISLIAGAAMSFSMAALAIKAFVRWTDIFGK